MHRRALLAWLSFAALAALPAALVLVVAWRARGAAIVEAQADEDTRLATAALDAKRELDGELARGRTAVRALAEHDDPLVRDLPRGAVAVVFDAVGALAVPAPPRDDAAPTHACTHARDALIGSDRAEARSTILRECPDLKSASGRYLWPLLALEDARAPELPAWIHDHRDRLGDAERDVLRRRLPPGIPERTEALAALDVPSSDLGDYRALASLLASRDETTDGALRIHEGSYVSILATTPSGRVGGVAFYAASILRSPPRLPPDLALAVGKGPAAVEVAPDLVFHVVARDPAARHAAVARAGTTLFAAASAAIVAALALAALLYARFLGARRLADLRTDFVAAVSHELRTPAASIQMLAELLEQGAVPADERAEIEKTLADESRRLSTTLGRMLRFGALSRGKLAVEKKRIALGPVVEDAVARFRRTHPDRVVELALDDAAEVDADAGLLGLALDNLLGNAAKYAPTGTPYRVRAAREGDRVVLSVSDRGPGLDRRAQRRVFLPFERADARLSRATEGTGIGLSLVRGIARAHDGEARVTSAPGKGATFTLELPWKPS